jgi:beta-glucanase (GH16 family)
MPDTALPAPQYAEIDMVEHLNFDSIAYQTLHSRYTLSRSNDQQPPHSTSAPIDPLGWNIYATEVWPDSVCFFINGEKTLTYNRMPEEELQFPWPDYPFYLILSNQLGGSWVGPIDHPEQLPSELRVDWIKVYQRKE